MLPDREWLNGCLSDCAGVASGRLDGLRLDGKIDLGVRVALLPAELLETVETADEGGTCFLEVDDFLDWRRRVSLVDGIRLNICKRNGKVNGSESGGGAFGRFSR